MPDDDAQVDAGDHEGEEDEPEPEVRALRLALTVPVRAPTRPVQLVGVLDGGRIELQRFVDRFLAAGRLGHDWAA